MGALANGEFTARLACPKCGEEGSDTKSSRGNERRSEVMRVRQCKGCGDRYKTIEVIQAVKVARKKTRRFNRKSDGCNNCIHMISLNANLICNSDESLLFCEEDRIITNMRSDGPSCCGPSAKWWRPKDGE